MDVQQCKRFLKVECAQATPHMHPGTRTHTRMHTHAHTPTHARHRAGGVSEQPGEEASEPGAAALVGRVLRWVAVAMGWYIWRACWPWWRWHAWWARWLWWADGRSSASSQQPAALRKAHGHAWAQPSRITPWLGFRPCWVTSCTPMG